MIPWPIALLTLFYGFVAALSASAVWKIAAGSLARPIVWPAAWLALSAALMCGLPLLKPWARTLAIVGSWSLALITLAYACLLTAAGRPGLALAGGFLAGMHFIVIRYLKRPAVKAYFGVGNA
jgi:hypothetical protein